ncbi:hypothetical protein V6N11_028208 [Hibiscus sabdariffa]|uniref:Uncharacterized protein n=1 Tax=Hibiscus sabdariffa TaxID=183260 RepID=A0ABR1ZWW5_9ROSI
MPGSDLLDRVTTGSGPSLALDHPIQLQKGRGDIEQWGFGSKGESEWVINDEGFDDGLGGLGLGSERGLEGATVGVAMGVELRVKADGGDMKKVEWLGCKGRGWVVMKVTGVDGGARWVEAWGT